MKLVKYLIICILLFSLTHCIMSNMRTSEVHPKKVAEGVYRGERPLSFKDLNKIPVKYVVNLQSGVYEKFSTTPYEKEKAEDFYKVEIQKKWGDFHSPTPEELTEIAQEIEKYSEKGGVYVHCLHGKDRTGMAIAAWRILYNGWTAELAIKEMDEHGFHDFPYFFWKKQLRKLTDRPQKNSLKSPYPHSLQNESFNVIKTFENLLITPA